jgi:hypothetical protein
VEEEEEEEEVDVDLDLLNKIIKQNMLLKWLLEVF